MAPVVSIKRKNSSYSSAAIKTLHSQHTSETGIHFVSFLMRCLHSCFPLTLGKVDVWIKRANVCNLNTQTHLTTLIMKSHPSKCFSPHLTLEKLPGSWTLLTHLSTHTYMHTHTHTHRHSCTFHYCRLSYLRAKGKIRTPKVADFMSSPIFKKQ